MNDASVIVPPMKEGITPQEITARSKSNFVLSFWFLPRAQRRAITNFYALSRVIDDAVDEHNPEEGKKILEFWRKEIVLCYEGEPTQPIVRAMRETIQKFSIPRNYLDLLLEGCEMDLTKHRYDTYKELSDYCYRVAGVIGLICMKIFGLQGPEAEQAAEELGMALQLTNILRDIKSDGARGRIYLPLEDIRRYRLTEDDLLKGGMNPRLHILLKLHADRAQVNFDRAFTKMKKFPHRPLIAAWIMGRVYQELLKKIRAKNYDVYTEKISLSWGQKFWIACSERLRFKTARPKKTELYQLFADKDVNERNKTNERRNSTT